MKVCLDSQIFEILIVKKGEYLRKAQVLRGEVFFGKTLLDQDAFDKACEHLVVIDKKTQQVVGTYRLLLRSQAEKTTGFYSETEFNLKNIKNNCRGELLEMGRACVDARYRKFPILNFLWKAIISYMVDNKVKFIFGCSSIEEPQPAKVSKIFKFLKDNAFSPPRFRVAPLKNKRYPYFKEPVEYSRKEALSLVPSLVKGYLTMGAVACGEPAWDKEFDTADFFMMVETEKMNASFLRKFFYEKSI
ncbi:MAG: GNAT family N-acetyltransferase [Candidatus Omnitrophica bacterium]|nr:GNAT family N-acetyltransferase [Candidatus Omnitrophota bacterium]